MLIKITYVLALRCFSFNQPKAQNWFGSCVNKERLHLIVILSVEFEIELVLNSAFTTYQVSNLRQIIYFSSSLEVDIICHRLI